MKSLWEKERVSDTGFGWRNSTLFTCGSVNPLMYSVYHTTYGHAHTLIYAAFAVKCIVAQLQTVTTWINLCHTRIQLQIKGSLFPVLGRKTEGWGCSGCCWLYMIVEWRMGKKKKKKRLLFGINGCRRGAQRSVWMIYHRGKGSEAHHASPCMVNQFTLKYFSAQQQSLYRSPNLWMQSVDFQETKEEKKNLECKKNVESIIYDIMYNKSVKALHLNKRSNTWKIILTWLK